MNREYDQDHVCELVESTTRDDRDIRRGKSPRGASGKGTYLRAVASEVTHVAQQHVGMRAGAAGETGERADEVVRERTSDLTVSDESESMGPATEHFPASTEEDWRRVLRFLADGEDREVAVYERARNRLLQFFAARGKLGDEELADATFDRVVAKLSDEVVAQVRSPVGYMLRFAHFIYLEHVKSEIARRSRLAALQLDDSDCTETAQEQRLRDERLALLDRCLEELPPVDRELLLAYYSHDGRSRIVSRQKMSQELGITPALLRTRVSRLLTTLNQRVRTLADHAELG